MVWPEWITELEDRAEAGDTQARRDLGSLVLGIWHDLCVDCGGYATEVHHVIGRRYEGAWDIRRNMVPLCPHCHRLKNKGAGAHTHEARNRHLRLLRDTFGVEYTRPKWVEALEEAA